MAATIFPSFLELAIALQIQAYQYSIKATLDLDAIALSRSNIHATGLLISNLPQFPQRRHLISIGGRRSGLWVPKFGAIMEVCRLSRLVVCRYWKRLYEVVVPEAYLYNKAFRAALLDELREMVQDLDEKGGFREARLCQEGHSESSIFSGRTGYEA